LPIHRQQHSKYGSIYAYKSEIELWWKARKMASRQRQLEPGRTPKPGPIPLKFRYPQLAIYAVLIVALALSIAKAKQMFLNRRPVVLTHPVTIAVLPFRSLSGNPEDASTALNLTEQVVTDCKKSSAMRLVDQSQLIPFQNSTDSPQHIAQLLHSDKVLSATASRSGNSIRVAAQLIDSKSGDAVWSRQFQGNAADLPGSEKKIAGSIAADVENVVVEESHP
jgi:TolB-like protein